MREYVGGYKYTELPDWITCSFFYCIKDEFAGMSITNEVCPLCEQNNINFDKNMYLQYQEDSFQIGIQILFAIDKTKNNDENLLTNTRNIILDVLYNRFLIEHDIKFNKQIKLSKALKHYSCGKINKKFEEQHCKLAERYYNENKEQFSQYIYDNYRWLCGDANNLFSDEKIKNIIDHYKEQYIWNGAQRHIKSIEVEDLFGYHSYILNMSADNLSIIIGTNGLGKTTIFRILQCLFFEEKDKTKISEKQEFLFEVPFKKISITFNTYGYIVLEKENKKENKIKINSKRESSFNCTDKEFYIYKGNDESDVIYETLCSNFPEIYYKDKRFCFVKTKRLETEDIQEILGKKKFSENDFETFATWFRSLYYDEDPSRKELGIENDTLVVKTSKEEPVDVGCLSSGELNVLAVLFEIWFMTSPGAIVLIDEPEISLHIAWQQRLGEIIADMVKIKRGVQVIVATHSPFIASSNPESVVEAKLME